MDKPVSVAKKLTVNDMTPSSGIVVPTDQKSDKSSKPKKSSKVPYIIMGVLLLLATAFSTFMYLKYRDVTSDPAAAITEKNQAETDRVMTNLRKVLLITETDAPTVARVEEPDKLKSSNQEFYRDVQKGDYLIIFPKRAIIFRESQNQIINVAPIINTADLKAQTDASTAPADSTEQTTKE